jgi:hypothetical protein
MGSVESGGAGRPIETEALVARLARAGIKPVEQRGPFVSVEGSWVSAQGLVPGAGAERQKRRRVPRGRSADHGPVLSGLRKSAEWQTNQLAETGDPNRELLRLYEGLPRAGRGWEAPSASLGRSHESGPKTATDGAIAGSIEETITQFMEGLLEKALIVAAHCVAPVVGHAVVLLFDAKELVGDAAALGSDGPAELHVPLLHLPPGVELEVGVDLGDEDEGDSPGLILFMAPGNGGLLHGLALERKKDEEAESEEAPEEGAVIRADLSPVLEASRDPQKVAAILRRMSTRLGPRLWDMDQYRETSFITIYDEQARLGVWLARPDDAGNARKIVVEEDAETGRLLVRLEV